MLKLKTYCKYKNIKMGFNEEIGKVYFTQIYFENDERKGKMLTLKINRLNCIIKNNRVDFLINYLDKIFID